MVPHSNQTGNKTKTEKEKNRRYHGPLPRTDWKDLVLYTRQHVYVKHLGAQMKKAEHPRVK